MTISGVFKLEIVETPKRGRPTRHINFSGVQLAAAAEYFEITKTCPRNSREKPKGKKGEIAAREIGQRLNVAQRTVLEWVKVYKRNVKLLDKRGFDGVEYMKLQATNNRQR